MAPIPSVPTTLIGLLVFAIGLIILWAMISIPVYFGGKAVTGGKASFGNAMAATLGGGLAYFIVYFGVSFFLGSVLGASAGALAAVLALIVWLAVYKAAFQTGWLGAVGIVLVAWVVLIVLDFALVRAFGVDFPDFFPF